MEIAGAYPKGRPGSAKDGQQLTRFSNPRSSFQPPQQLPKLRRLAGAQDADPENPRRQPQRARGGHHHEDHRADEIE